MLRSAAVAIALIALAIAAAACGDDGDGDASPTATAPPDASPTSPGPSSGDIRDVDFTTLPEVGRFIDALGGGEVVPSDITYGDLTEDGEPEAVVPIFSGGTAGNIAYMVFTLEDGGLRTLLAGRPESGRVQVNIQGGALKEVQPIYGENDPNCCPSQLQNTYYQWNGSELIAIGLEIIDNPDAMPP